MRSCFMRVPAVWKTALPLLLFAMFLIPQRAHASLSATGTVSTAPYEGEMLIIPETLNGKHFMSVPDDGILFVYDPGTSATTTFSLDSGNSRPWGLGVYDNGAVSKVYIADRDNFRVFIYEEATLSVTGTITGGVGLNPISVAVNSDPAELVGYVTNSGSNSVSVFDVVTDTRIGTISRTGMTKPWGVAVNETTNRVFVSSYDNGKIFVFQGKAGSYAYVTEITVFATPTYIEVNEDDNLLYVAHNSVSYMTIIDCSDYSVKEAKNLGAQGYSVTYQPDLGFYYISMTTAGEIMVFDARNDALLDDTANPITGFTSPKGIAMYTPGLGIAGSSPWYVGVADSTGMAIRQTLTTETYPPDFDGLDSATDAGDPVTATVYLNWAEASDTTPPLSYYIYKSATSGVFTDPPEVTALFGTYTYTTGIDYGETWYFKVHAVDSASPPNEDTNIVEESVLVTDGEAPTGGELTSAADTTQGREVQLNWTLATDNSPPITYNIYVAQSSGNYNYSIPYLQVTGTTTYTLDDLLNNTTYYFVVRASDIAGLTNTNTTEFSATPTDTTDPTFAGLSAAADDSTGGTVNLSWAAATDNSTPIYYNIYYEQGAAISSYATPQMSVTGVTVLQVTGLTNNVQYVFAVRAEDAEDNEDGNVVERTVTPTDPTPPSFDGVYSCEDAGSSDGIDLIWNSAIDNSTPISYNVYFATQSGAGNYNFASWSYQTQSLLYTASGLTMGQDYYVIVRAKDAADNEETNTVEAGPCTPTDGAAPDFDGIQTATATRISGEVYLAWDAATDLSLPITYNVYEALTTGWQTYGTPTTTTAATSVTLAGRTDGQSYFYVVRAEDGGTLEDTNTSEFEAIPNDGTPPVFAGISSLTDAGTYGTLMASWVAAVDPVTPMSYNVFISTTTNFEFDETPDTTTTMTSVELSGLTNNTAYNVVVRAVDGAGVTSTHTTPMTATPTDSTPPTFGGISGVTDNASGGSLTIAYPAASDDSKPITYHIFMATSPNPISYATADYTTTSRPYVVNGLTNGTLYSFSVWAEDAASPSNFATNASVLGGTPSDSLAPAFSGISTAESASGTSNAVDLAWSAASDYSKPITYNIYYHTSNVAANIVAQGVRATTTATMTTVTGLENGTYWYFVVRAQDAEGNTDSNIIVRGAVPQDREAPTFAGLSSASDTTVGGEVTLTWSAAVDTHATLFYNIYYGITSCGNTVKQTTTNLTYSITGLTNNSLYCFEVGAEDGAGNETRGVKLFATPTDQTAPTFSGLSTASDATVGGSVLLSWTAGTDRSTPITYNVYESTTGAFNFSTPAYQTQNSSSYTVPGLTDGQMYYYIVTAQDASTYANESATAAAKTVTPTDSTPPSFSGLGDIDIYSENGIVSVSWNAATDNTEPIFYNVYKSNISNNFGGFASPTTTVSATTQALISGLIDNKWYFFVVRAEDSASPSNETTNTTQTSFQFQDEVGPNPPTSIKAVAGDTSSATGDEYITISWASPTTNTDNSTLVDLTGYDVFRGTSPGVYATTVNGTTLIGSTATSFVDTTCEELITYYYVVVAYDDAENSSPLSSQVQSKCINSDDKIPSAPSGLAASSSDGQVTLSWDRPTLNTDGSTLTDLQGYNVRRSETQGANYVLINSSIVAPGSGTGKEIYIDTDVVNDTKYYYVVTALDTSDPANESSYSDEVSATPGAAPDYPPAAPSGLSVSASNGTAYLNWTAPALNSDGSNIGSDLAGYNVYRTDDPESSWTKRNSSLLGSPSYTDADLTSGVMYYYYVTALDNAAQESASSSQVVAIYGSKGITGRIRYRDPESVTSGGYELTGIALLEVYLVNSSGETLVTSYTSGDGTFTLVYEDAEIGVPYDVRLKVEDGTGFPYDALVGGGAGYLILAEDMYIQETGFTAISPDPPLLGKGPTQGDLNCDGQINLFDLSYMKPAYGSQEGESNYLKNADANGDGQVNLLDISVLKGYYGHQTMSLVPNICEE